MSDRGIEDQGVVIVSDCLFYCLIDRLTHSRIILAVAELPDDQSAQVGKNAAHTQVADHAVDMIMAFRYIFNKQDRELVPDKRILQTKLRSLEAIEHRQVSAYNGCTGLAFPVKGMVLPAVLKCPTGQGAT